jgi:hypothetical protein
MKMSFSISARVDRDAFMMLFVCTLSHRASNNSVPLILIDDLQSAAASFPASSDLLRARFANYQSIEVSSSTGKRRIADIEPAGYNQNKQTPCLYSTNRTMSSFN